MVLTGPSSQTIAAMAARDATMPRTTSTHWFSSSGLDYTLASRLGSMTMCKIRMRNAQAPTFQAIKRRVASRMSTPKLQRDIGRDHQDRSRQETRPMRKGGQEPDGGFVRPPYRFLAEDGALGVPAALSALGGEGDLGMRGHSGPEEACLARGGGEGQATLTAPPVFDARQGDANGGALKQGGAPRVFVPGRAWPHEFGPRRSRRRVRRACEPASIG